MANARQIKAKMKDRKESKKVLQEHLKEVYKGMGDPPAYTNGELIAWRLANYLYTASDADKPLTETGLAVALLIDRTTFHTYLDGSRDHLTGGIVEPREGYKAVDKCLQTYRNMPELIPWYSYLVGLDPASVAVDVTLLNTVTGQDTSFTVVDSPEASYSPCALILLSTPCKRARLLVTLSREERLATQGKIGNIFEMKAREGWQDEKVVVNKLELPKEEEEGRLKALGWVQKDE